MTELEKLNERITQLTELVKTGSEAIKSMEAALEAAEKERDRLADQRRETEPKFERGRNGEQYYTIEFNSYHGFIAVGERGVDLPTDKGAYDNNNYFRAKRRVQEVADKLNFLL